jgi:hypothetical protein
MKRTTAAAIFVTSIVVFPTAVKTRAADLPNVSPASRKTDLKDSVKDNAKKDLTQLIDFLMKHGLDGKIGENLAPVIGLPGPMPMKGQTIRNNISGKERNALNCTVIYEETADPSVPNGKKPSCVYLVKITESPRVKDSQYFRINLDGRLERVLTSRGKKDDSGALIPGSGVALDDDLESSAVRKTFAAEMRELKAWLKVQQKLVAKKSPASAAKSGAVAAANAASAQATP